MDNLCLSSSKMAIPQAANLIDYLSRSELGSIVFATTNNNAAKTLVLHGIVELREVASKTAQRMLENHMNAPVLEREQQGTTNLLKELSYLPPAIVQATTYMNNGRDITLEDYRLQVIMHKEEAVQLSSESSKENLQYHHTEDAINATLLFSLDQIRRNHRLAAEHLFLAACVDCKDISINISRTAPETENAVQVLHSFALIKMRPTESAFDLHQLVHLAVGKWLQKRYLLEKWTQKAIARLSFI